MKIRGGRISIFFLFVQLFMQIFDKVRCYFIIVLVFWDA